MRTLRTRLSQSQLVEKSRAEQRYCPPRPRGCGAEPGQPCLDLRTGRPLGRQLAHAHRLNPPLVTSGAPATSEQTGPDPWQRAAGSHR